MDASSLISAVLSTNPEHEEGPKIHVRSPKQSSSAKAHLESTCSQESVLCVHSQDFGSRLDVPSVLEVIILHLAVRHQRHRLHFAS